MFFGIFMVFVYLGMAVLMAINFFNFLNTPLWTAARWFFAVMLALYGFYRLYREIKGEHTYGMRVYDEDDSEYSTYADELKKTIIDNNEKKN
jgi:hypothetical protein